jgi:arylsulfatase
MRFLPGRWQLSATTLALVLALFFTALNYGFFRTVWQAWREAGGDGTFLWSVPLFLFLCLNIVFHLLLLPFLHKVIIPLVLLLSAAVSYSVIFLGVYFDRAMLTNVLITTPAESAKLLTVPYALWLLALGVVPALLYLRVRVVYRRWWRELALRLGAVLVSLALALLLSHHYYQEYAAYGRNNHDLPHLIVPTNFIVASISKIKHQRRANRPYETVAADAHQQKTDPQRRVSVFIIGEATRAQNWGLNGYARQTTPQLAARGAEVINYPQVSSCGTYTAYSVPCMLSEQPRTRFDVDIASRRDNLLDILQRAGVRVSGTTTTPAARAPAPTSNTTT